MNQNILNGFWKGAQGEVANKEEPVAEPAPPKAETGKVEPVQQEEVDMEPTPSTYNMISGSPLGYLGADHQLTANLPAEPPKPEVGPADEALAGQNNEEQGVIDQENQEATAKGPKETVTEKVTETKGDKPSKTVEKKTEKPSKDHVKEGFMKRANAL